jgi:predicted PurR-regulated permease PerM
MTEGKDPGSGAVSESDRMTRLVRSCVILLLTAVLVFSRTIAVPALAAVLLSIALFPFVNRAARAGVPRALASILALLTLVGVTVSIIYSVREPLTQLLARGPDLVEIGQRLLANFTGRTPGAVAARQERAAAVMEMLAPVAAHLTAALIAIGTSLILSNFILTCGTSVGRAVLAAVRERPDRRNWLRVCGSIRTQAAYYLQLVTLINLVFGVLTGLLLSLLQVKDAAAYGLVAGLMNFIPIVGAPLSACVIVAGGIAEHGVTAEVLLPAALFLMLHILESQFVTPLLLGRRLLLNPLIVIAGVLVGAAAWGVGGAFLAVPILTSVKIALDAHPNYRRWGQVLGRGALMEPQPSRSRLARLRRAARARPAASKS